MEFAEKEHIISFNYRGFEIKIHYNKNDKTYYGEILNIDDKVIFETEDLFDVFNIHKEVVDNYLEMRNDIDKSQVL